MDDRLRAIGAKAVVGFQLAGSEYGLSVDSVISHTMETGKVPDTPADELAKPITSSVERPGRDRTDAPQEEIIFESELHEACASEGDMADGVHAVAGSTLEELAAVLAELGENPDDHELEKIRDAYRLVAAAGVVRPPAKAAETLTSGRQRFPRVALDGSHVAGDVILDRRPSGGYDKYAARLAKLSAYRISIGRLPEYAYRIQHGTGLAVAETSLVSASLIRHGLLLRKLPVPASNPDGKLHIHTKRA